jgi:deoxyribonuclease-4
MQGHRDKHDLYPLVIHDSYLINLASASPGLRAQSIAAFRCEIERAVAIGADYLVMHPGNHKDQSLEQGMVNIIQSLGEAARGIQSTRLQILLENTAGARNSIGARFEELAALRELSQQLLDIEVGFCLDTCHLFVQGFDVSTPEGLRHTVKSADQLLGLNHVKVIHTNDAKAPLGSHLDRHQNIGEGYIGLDGFRRILNHPKLRGKAFILETPVDNEGDDRRNVDTLKSLCRKSSTAIKKSS